MAEPSELKKSHPHSRHHSVPHPDDAAVAKPSAAKKPAKQGSASGTVQWCAEVPVGKEANSNAAPQKTQDKSDRSDTVRASDLQNTNPQNASPVVAPHGWLSDSWNATNHATPDSNGPPAGTAPAGVYNRIEGEVRVEIKAGPFVVVPYAGYASSLDPTHGAPAAESVERAGVKLQAGPASVQAEAAVRHNGSSPAAPVNYTDGDLIAEYDPSANVGPSAKVGVETSVLVRVSPNPAARLAAGTARFAASETLAGVTLTQKTGISATTFYDPTQKRNDLYLDIATLGVEKKVGPVTLAADLAARVNFSTDAPHDRVVEIRGTLLKAKVDF